MVQRAHGLVHLLVAFSLVGTVSAQSLPTLGAIVVNGSISAGSGDILVYSYEVFNPKSSSGLVWLVSLDISKPTGTAELSTDGLINDVRFFVNTSQKILGSLGNEMIPIGVQAPPNWNSGLTVNRTVQWSAPDLGPLIAPGSSMIGFQVTSRGLPGIRVMEAEADLDPDKLPITPPSDASDMPRYVADLAALKSKMRASVITIGPTSAPVNFTPMDFVKTIQAYETQSVQQGWIKNSGIAKSLEAKLSAAQNAIQRGNSSAARNELNAFLNEIDAQSGKQLTPEAGALLKYNAQFLISKLQ